MTQLCASLLTRTHRRTAGLPERETARQRLGRPAVGSRWLGRRPATTRHVVISAFLGLLLWSSSAAAQPDGPISGFLKDIFGANETPNRKLDLIDRHAAAASRELSRSLEQIDQLAVDGQWGVVVQQLQTLVDLPEDALIFNGSSWTSLKRTAEERLLKLPEDGRRAYLNQFEKTANDELAEARASGDFKAVCRVAARFRLTPAGQSALDQAALLMADAGDFVTAAMWYSELQKDGAAVTTTLEWKARAAAVWKQLGQDEKARRLVPDDQPASGTVAAKPNINPVPAGDQSTGPYGGPGRFNTARGDRPLLLEEWSAPATQNASLQDDIEQLQADLFDSEHRPIPVSHALAVNGITVLRTLGGLEVRDAATGKLRWKTRGRASAESLLTAELSQPAPAVTLSREWDDPDTHPLTSLFYRDAVIGQVTADRQRLFAVSRQAALLSGGHDLYTLASAVGAAVVHGDHSVNTIVAFDLATGRTLWTAGGSKSDAPFASPLAGVYFFGPPTVDGAELFVIGAAGDDINLYCLDAATGHPQWRQFIAQYDNAKIADDVARQMWSCSPSVTRGTIYCPTNAGWLVAVDRCRRRLAWAMRYAEGEVSDRYQPQYSLSGLDERWSPGAPIVVDGVVVFAPPELPDEPSLTEPQLFRIDAVTGKSLFSRVKGDAVAVAGVFGDVILIAGRQSLEAWPLSRKRGTQWTVRYPDDLTPCGLGVTVNGVYWAPFVEGAIVGFHVSDGKVEAVLRNDALEGRLGNLTFHGDRVISAGPTGVVGLWQKSAFEARVAERLANNPRDLEAHLRLARVLFAEGKLEEALSQLEAADLPMEANSDLARSANELLWSCLVGRLSEADARDDSRWSTLDALASSPARREILGRMQIDRAIARGDWDSALERCWARVDGPLSVFEHQGLHVREDAWLAARLADIWTQGPESIRNELTQRITTRSEIEPSKFAEQAPRLERLFAFHSQGRRLSLRLAEADAKNGELALAESRLADLMTSSEPEIAAAAVTRLASLYRQKDCPFDAARCIRQAETIPPETRLPDGTTLGDWLSTWKQTSPDPARQSFASRWNLANGRVVRMGMEPAHNTSAAMSIHGRPAAWMAGQRIEVVGSWDGLAWIDPATGHRQWSTPLASTATYEGESSAAATAEGSILAVCYRGLLHVYSPHDRRELWNWALPPRFITPSYYGWAEEHLSNQSTRTASAQVAAFGSNLDAPREGALIAIVGQRLMLLGQRELVVFDVRTGEELWRRTGISASALLVADENAVCVSAMQKDGEPAAFHLVDGRSIPAGSIGGVFKRAFAVEGRTVLTSQSMLSLFSSRVRLAAERSLTAEPAWTLAIPAETALHHLAGRELAGIEPEGQVFVVDVDSGKRTDVGRLTADQIAARPVFHILSDADRIYVALQRQQSFDLSYLAVPNITVSGELVAFDRKQRRQIWRERIREGSLLTAWFSESPVIVIAEHSSPERRRNIPDGVQLPELKLTVLDKATGIHVVDWTGATAHGGSPSSMTIDARNRRIDINSYNERIRLQFGPQTSTGP